MEYPPVQATDPLARSVSAVFGLKSLYPYQRLVISNILEAAGDAGMAIRWPEGEARAEAECERAACAFFESKDDRGGQALPEARDAEVVEASPRGKQIVILPTGAGKSLCFQLPALLLPRPTLVIYPLLSLMDDQARRLAERGFQAVMLRGGQTRGEREELFGRIASGEASFIIANPEVLLSSSMLERLPDLDIAHFVIDEAHCVSEWGESFRPAYLEIGRILAASKAPIVTAFTATASPPVLEKMERHIFGARGIHRIIGNPDRPNIRYYALGALDRDMAVLELLERFPLPAIVFSSSRGGCEQLARFLASHRGGGKNRAGVRFFHAGLERNEKEAVNAWYLSSPDGILCATCAWGMGVDKADIRTVIHRDCAPTIEAYLQESGRAGRDGQHSHAILLFGPEDKRAMARTEGPEEKERLEALLAYARSTRGCRREELLSLMGANFEACPGCDLCAGMANGFLREEGLIAGYVARNELRRTLGEAARELAGIMGGAWGSERVAACLRTMIGEGKLGCAKRGPWKGLVYRKGAAGKAISPRYPLHPLHPLGELLP